VIAHLQAKYGITSAQIADNQQRIRERGAELGFAFGTRSRIWNTFDAHRLLHAAGEQDLATQGRLKHALLRAYHAEGLNPGDPEVLRRCAEQAGLQDAQAVLADPQRHAHAVREAQAFWQAAGIRAVPAVVLQRRRVVSGGQPVEVFEQALRSVAPG
jgi:predicted DsbA family dithiol-disulfide isomerase